MNEASMPDGGPIRLRSSSVPMAMLCPPSVKGQGIRIDSDGDASRLGTAFHKLIAPYVTSAAVQTDQEVQEAAEDNGLGEAQTGELSFMLAQGRKAWDELAEYFPDPFVEQEVEVSLPGVLLTGHPDVISMTAAEEGRKIIRVLDWKTGRKTKDFTRQLLAYALAIVSYFGADGITVTVVWVRDGVVDTRKFNASQLEEFARELSAAMQSEGHYRTGEHCTWCPRFAECPARMMLVRQTVADLAQVDTAGLREIGGRLPEIRAGVGLLKKAIEDFEDALRQEITVGGPIAIGERKKLGFVPRSKRELDGARAWPVLENHLTREEIAETVSISLAKALDKVGANAPRGMKKIAKDGVAEELERAGAVRKTSYNILAEVEEPIATVLEANA